jgi:NADH peroxidase
VKKIVVVGAGYIGIEAAEVFAKAGKQVTVVDLIDRPLGNYLDPELADVVAKEIEQNNIKLLLGHTVQRFEGNKVVKNVVTDDGQLLPADLVIVAAGVQPNTKWLRNIVALDERGWIKTDAYLRTSQPDIMAIGDAILPLFAPAGKHIPVALASATRREARYVVENIGLEQPARPFGGVNGSSALSVFRCKLANTGLNEHHAKRLGLKTKSSLYVDDSRPSFVTDGNPKIMVKLIFDSDTHLILGAQLLSEADVTAHANTISLAIKGHMTLEDLAEADFFFQPGFDKQWGVLNLAAQTALGEKPSV